MSVLDAALLRRSLGDELTSRLEKIDVFGSMASTNSFLLTAPPPAAGNIRVVIADHQTAGRGRLGKRWLSPPGSGICLSIAYTFAAQPARLPVLTLALGVGVVHALGDLDVTGVSLKWPNDIVAQDRKLGGILTEVQSRPGAVVTVITGIGLNVALPAEADVGAECGGALRPVDLQTIAKALPAREVIGAALIGALYAASATFDAQGFAAFAPSWKRYDWLLGRHIVVEQSDRDIAGIAAGVDAEGALLVDTATDRIRVTSGSILLAERKDLQ